MCELLDRLAAPFAAQDVKSKPAVVSGNRALALFYVDARSIMQRLDDVVGVANWQDEYHVIADGSSVVCQLSIRIGDEWIRKEDVGSPSEQPDEGDRMKAAFSDALKRAAVKWGIGRYLYRLPGVWCDYDPAKKKFVTTPVVPGSAVASNGHATKVEAKADPVAEWKAFLDAKPRMESLNAKAPEIGKLQNGVKKAVWDLVMAYATSESWEFDTARKVFARKTAIKK
jgi:hypothetical protein